MYIKHKLDIVGDTFVDNDGREFIVLQEAGRNSHHEQLYDIQYKESGYINKARRRVDIRRGEVKDHYAPTVAGVGWCGDMHIPNKKTLDRKIYEIWKNMLYRCYSKTCKSYKTYGAKGVTVCSEWHNFENFYRDVKSLPGYNEEAIFNREVELDKDIINREVRQYNNETCQWVPVSANRKEGADYRWHKTERKQ